MASAMHCYALQQLLRTEMPGGHAERSLLLLRRQYLQRVPFNRMIWPLPKVLGIYEVQNWIFDSFKEFVDTEAPSRFDKQFWRLLSSSIEAAVQDEEDADIFDPLMQFCADIAAKPSFSEIDAAQKDVWLGYTIPTHPDLMVSDDKIFLAEKPNVVSGSGCTGHRTWDAALCLSYWLATNSHGQSYVKDKNVLELGAGTGLVGFACSKLGANRVIATDEQQDAVERILLNNAQNGFEEPSASSVANFGVYKWGEPFEKTIIGDELAAGRKFNTVFGADVTYDPSLFSDLIRTIEVLLHTQGASTDVIMAATIRNTDTHDKFIAALGKYLLQMGVNVDFVQKF